MAKFKARARALDLLGRQQIAGIPTAINELFKNAHDAYADNVEVDYFRTEKLFVLRDNGLGMTKADFESRWLTLGTESKFTNRKTPPPAKDPNKPERPIMGEKGIGRLAIASIGNQVLILTKAKQKTEDIENKGDKIVAAFINWNIFELPSLNLDDIIIPIREFEKLPEENDIEEMKEEMIFSFDKFLNDDDISIDEHKKLVDSIISFKISPKKIDDKIGGILSLNTGYGTHFYIQPVDESLDRDIDGNKESDESPKIEKMLVGFTNTMTPGHPLPAISAVFRDYKLNDGTFINIIDKEKFFTPEDFELADHHFNGEFDEFGQFKGVVEVYREKSYDHKVIWAGNSYKPTACGAFSINVAYFQGKESQSIIDRENYSRLYNKAEKYGGLYIYKDDIRILPYGNPEVDWLDIEKNRSKSASFYFFNSRRMFGVLNISKDINFNLKEKAGREGFIENKAYNQLRDILKNFFVQLAADFFRENSGGPKSEFWVQKRQERESAYRALQRRDKLAKNRKEKFQKDLHKFFADVSNNHYRHEVENLLNEAEAKFASVAHIESIDEASQMLIDHEGEIRKKLTGLKNDFKISAPKGFTISKETRQDYEAYLQEYEKLEKSLFFIASGNIDDLIEDYTTRLSLEINKRKRLEQAVDFLSIEATKEASKKKKEANEAVTEISTKVRNLANDLMIDLSNKIRDIKDRFKTFEMDQVGDFDLVVERQKIEDEINAEKEKATQILSRVIGQLQGIYWDKDSDDNYITNDQITDAISEELEELRERVNSDVELSQLGLAVSVIHHEFNSSVNSIRTSLKDLKAWADVNQKLEGVYNNIRINFEHLDGYLNLFTPLNRRLYRTKEDIQSNDVKIFLLDLFKARLERHNVELKHTKGFVKNSLFGYRSTFYPVFVNLVDNAIHWLNQKQDEGVKFIRLHADETGFYISNNGPEIPINDKERIFDLGFTRKLKGRGLGLNISREVLKAENYNIYVDEPKDGCTVTFKIEPIKTINNG